MTVTRATAGCADNCGNRETGIEYSCPLNIAPPLSATSWRKFGQLALLTLSDVLSGQILTLTIRALWPVAPGAPVLWDWVARALSIGSILLLAVAVGSVVGGLVRAFAVGVAAGVVSGLFGAGVWLDGVSGAQASAARHRAISPNAVVSRASFRVLRRRRIAKIILGGVATAIALASFARIYGPALLERVSKKALG